jgi:glycosyltransferase involved in cell wall biosynthesis
MKPTVSVVVVVRNEENSITQVIKEVSSLLPRITSGYEILVHDDASTDKTPEILEDLRHRNKHIQVYHQRNRLGIARSLEFLYKKGQCRYVFTLPGDGQYSIKDLPDMLEKAADGCAIVVGKRIHKQYTPERLLISFLFNALSFVMFGIHTIDAGSIKLYRRSILSEFQPVSRGVYNEAERIIRASLAGYVIGSSPVHHKPRSGGRATGAKPRLIWEAFTDMVRLWFLLRVRRMSPVTMGKEKV